MSTNDVDDGLVNLPPSPGNMRVTVTNIEENYNRAFTVRDHVFYTLFYKFTLGYVRMIPRSLRALIEFVFLLKAVLSFVLLVYVHMNFSQVRPNCLEHVKNTWPRDGVLRVEIIELRQRFFAEQLGTLDDLFTIEQSYKREFKQIQLDTNKNASRYYNSFTKMNNSKNKRDVDIEPLSEDIVVNNYQESSIPKTNFLFSYKPNVKDDKKEIYSSTTSNWNRDMSELNFSPGNDSARFCSSKYSNSSIRRISGIDINSLIYSNTIKPLLNDEDESPPLIVEYSLEDGFLHLSPKARSQLGIPVMLVLLEPTVHKCFGDSTDQFFFEYFLGYEDLLTSSMNSLIENEQNQGYIRSVNFKTKNRRFLSIWMSIILYIATFFIMVLFTVSTSMLLRYMHDQIFLFIEDVLRMLDFHDSITIPMGPFLTVILAMTGIDSIMMEFFKDNTTSFHVMVIVWIADQYDSICSHSPITKKHWLKFFYLYHFLFYAYHNRFNGQYSNLTLICSWFFIQHSMIYFYHHYELPYVLHQARLQQLFIQRQLQLQQQQQQLLLQQWRQQQQQQQQQQLQQQRQQ